LFERRTKEYTEIIRLIESNDIISRPIAFRCNPVRNEPGELRKRSLFIARFISVEQVQSYGFIIAWCTMYSADTLFDSVMPYFCAWQIETEVSRTELTFIVVRLLLKRGIITQQYLTFIGMHLLK
jgi:hypothetical protein